MWGFAAGVAAEFGSHESILQQAGGHLFGVTFFMLLISVASIMPKFASGVPIGEKCDLLFRSHAGRIRWLLTPVRYAPLQGNCTMQPAKGACRDRSLSSTRRMRFGLVRPLSSSLYLHDCLLNACLQANSNL